MKTAVRPSIEDVLARMQQLLSASDAELAPGAGRTAEEILDLGEAVLEVWLDAKGLGPVHSTSEGFRVLALHRQGARGDPSFNACRETCREIVYYRNVIIADPTAPDAGRRARLAAMVLRHLAHFIAGKLETAGLGEFCCSSRPVRQSDAISSPNGTA
jgi:hypothetical protein